MRLLDPVQFVVKRGVHSSRHTAPRAVTFLVLAAPNLSRLRHAEHACYITPRRDAGCWMLDARWQFCGSSHLPAARTLRA